MKGFFFVSIFGKSHHRVIVVGWVFAFKMMIMMNLLSVGWLVGWLGDHDISKMYALAYI